MRIDREYILDIAKRLLETDSPTGYTSGVMELIEGEAGRLGYAFSRTNKGNGVIDMPGKTPKLVGLCAHVDTLGLMVRSVKPAGTLAFTSLGGPQMPTLDGEYCRVYTRAGKVFTGTILSNSAAAHVYTDAGTLERKAQNMEVRLDEVVKSDEETRALGISAGDIICIDTKTEITPSGFIKSRFLDDKLSVAILLGVLKAYGDAGLRPELSAKMLISTYEEVGHGMAYLPEGIRELIAVDMGCIGDDLSCTEYDVSICAKDSSGPYDYELTSRLIDLAEREKLPYAVDIYPYYGSDVSAALRGGNDVRGALIGPGVHASHGMERSHWSAVEASVKLIAAYLGG